MNPRFECRSESKPRIQQSRNTYSRTSLQNENPLFKSRRSSSLDRARSSGGLPKPRSNSEERKSILCNPRRSSIGLNDCKIQKDPRPLSDKGYQRKKFNELVEFMNEDFKVNISKVTPPSKKDFETMFQILANVFEPDFVVKRIEEDAPRILKSLRYPFIPAKSAFVYVARNNWPTLLGVLLYLMDLSKYINCVDMEMFYQTMDAERPQELAILLKYIVNSYSQQIDDEEKEVELFTTIIKRNIPYDIEELREKNKELKEALKEVEMETEAIQELKTTSARYDGNLKQYEDYFNRMEEYQKKRKAKIEKLLEQLAEKENALKELQNVLVQKQAAYDAQGFDGKKQMCYFEDQKRELMEKLQSKKTAVKKLTSDYHDAEIQYSKTKDEGASVCDTFNKLYLEVNEKAADIFNNLKNINNPIVKDMCSKMGHAFELPDCKMDLTQRSILQLGDERKRVLNEIRKNFDSVNLVLNSVASKQNENLQEILMRKSDLAVKIKVANSLETKKEHDFHSDEKQVLNEVKTYEAQCEELLKKLDEVRKEKNNVEKSNIGDLEELVNLRKIKEKMLTNYLEIQKVMVSRQAANIKAAKENAENAGIKICEVISKALEEKEQ